MNWLKLVLPSLLLFTGCANSATNQRIQALETQVVALNQQVGELKGVIEAGVAPSGPSQAEEEQGRQIFMGLQQALTGLNTDKAKELHTRLVNEFAETEAGQYAQQIAGELNVIGREAGELDVDKWYSGKVAMNDGKATLLVFWEKWCPHCKREVPILEQTYQSYKDKGLNIVGLTKASRGISDDDVMAFIEEKNLTYPTAKDDGALSDRFSIRGIPASVIIKDGKVVWRGHPGRISSAMIEKVLQ